jgi:hypothetical protein
MNRNIIHGMALPAIQNPGPAGGTCSQSLAGRSATRALPANTALPSVLPSRPLRPLRENFTVLPFPVRGPRAAALITPYNAL